MTICWRERRSSGILFVALPIVLAGHSVKAEPQSYKTEHFKLDATAEVSKEVKVLGASPALPPIFTDPAPKKVRYEKPGAQWLVFAFNEFDLGRNSTLVIKSLIDGASQRLTQDDLELRGGVTATFVGPAVDFILDVAPGDTNIKLPVGTVAVGEAEQDNINKPGKQTGAKQESGNDQEGVCSSSDTRQLSKQEFVGRLWPSKCTAFLIEEDIIVTAGHCFADFDDRIETVQFNVPPSDNQGNPRYPLNPDDQYPLRPGKWKRGIDYEYDNDLENAPNNNEPGYGSDWLVFVAPNVGKGTPHHRQGGAFPIARDLKDLSNGMITVTGYGKSQKPTYYLSQQTAYGRLKGEVRHNKSAVALKHSADTSKGASGAPVLMTVAGAVTAVGIHDGGSCLNEGTPNFATGFSNETLWRAIQKLKDVQLKLRGKDVVSVLSRQTSKPAK